MSRPIKFRLWDSGEMIDWDQIKSRGYYVSSISAYGDDVMQFTGMLDKNGVEVYEGDVMKMYKHSDGSPCVVTFEDGCYNCFPFGTLDSAVKYGIVIGNIHENPELLTKNQ